MKQPIYNSRDREFMRMFSESFYAKRMLLAIEVLKLRREVDKALLPIVRKIDKFIRGVI